MRILNFEKWKLPPSNFSMTFKDSIWKEDILKKNAITNTLFKRLKALEEIFHTSCQFDIFNISKTSFLHTSNIQLIEKLSSTHFLKLQSLKFSTIGRTLFQTLSPWNLILSKNLKNKFFHTWKNLQDFEEISSTHPIHLEMDSYSLGNLSN
jgi:hypothetical protein